MPAGFKKPTAVLRDAKVALYKAVGADVPADARRGFTDRMEILSPSLMIGYKNAPSDATKAALVAGANKAQEIMRAANDQVAAVMMLRKDEPAVFTEVMDKHFGLIEGDLGSTLAKDGTTKPLLKSNKVNNSFSLRSFGKKDRRWVLEKIRQQFLSISFHLNTGIYLIDADDPNRDIRVGVRNQATGTRPNEEAYVGSSKKKISKDTWEPQAWDLKHGLLAGFQNGEIHLAFNKAHTYSDVSLARIIIHEATHKYLGVRDHAYAHQDKYATLNLLDTLNNADSIAWAAVSLYCSALKMGSPADVGTDWWQCSK